jgi:hypothetical protein
MSSGTGRATSQNSGIDCKDKLRSAVRGTTSEVPSLYKGCFDCVDHWLRE